MKKGQSIIRYIYSVNFRIQQLDKEKRILILEWLKKHAINISEKVPGVKRVTIGVVKFNEEETSFEARYEFETKKSFEEYEENFAEKYRQEGIEFFTEMSVEPEFKRECFFAEVLN